MKPRGHNSYPSVVPDLVAKTFAMPQSKYLDSQYIIQVIVSLEKPIYLCKVNLLLIFDLITDQY